jgi:hypothetical protein
MANVRPLRRQNQGLAEATDSDNIQSGGSNQPTSATPPGGTPAAGRVTIWTNTTGHVIRTNSAGVSAVIGPLFTRTATTSAELITGLASSDDLFIVAGSYTIDISTFVLDTTPRTIWGAGMDKVTITLTNGGPPAELDFSAGRTAIAGTILTELTLTSSAPTVGVGMVAGLFGAVNVKCIGTVATSVFGFRDCQHLVNCIATNFRDGAGFAGFSACEDLTNCKVESFDSFAFTLCKRLANCRAVAVATLFVAPDQAGFHMCEELSDCEADYSATAVVVAPHHGFFSCFDLSASRAIGPGVPVGPIQGFTGCEEMGECRASGFETNYGGCIDVSSTRSTDPIITGFDGCADMGGCRSTGGATGYFACQQVSGSRATGASGDGFSSCLRISACNADSNGGDGFDGCSNISGSIADSNTSFGFRDCNQISASEATGNGSGAHTGCTNISIASTNFPHVITPTTLAVNTDDYDLVDAQIARISASVAVDITGIADGSGIDRHLWLVNVGTFAITLKNQDASSAAENRIITGTGIDLVMGADAAVHAYYDDITNRWRTILT